MKSLFSRHFLVYALVIIFGFVVLGSTFLFQVNRFSQRIKISQVEKCIQRAEQLTLEFISLNQSPELGSVSTSWYANRMREFAEDCQGIIFVANPNGRLIFYITPQRAYIQDEEESGRGELPAVAVEQLKESGYYESQSTFHGWFNDMNYILGEMVMANDSPVAAVFVASPTDTQLYMDLTRTFVILVLIVFVVTIIASVLVVRSTIKPVSDMAKVASSFSKGDFSARVPLPKRQDELYEMTISFNKMADAMENAETSRKALIASVSHDLRTPMTTISGFVDGILDGTIKPDKQEHYLRIISEEIKRLSRMASSMLEISKTEAISESESKSRFDICEIIRRVIINFEQNITEKNIDLTIDIPDTQIIVGIHDSIFQVIYNLFDNALKYCDDGGKITIYLAEKSGNIDFHIINSGEEIKAEDMRHIFERFYKADSSRQKNTGSGLGLYIVKTIVNRHGGDVYAKSEDGKTEFCFTIPVK